MAELFGLTGKELIFFKAQSLACGDFGKFKMSEAEGLDYFAKFCGNLTFDDFGPGVIVNSFHTMCQDTLLKQEELPYKLLIMLASFSEFGRANLTRLVQAWEAGREQALEKAFWDVFKEGWEAERARFKPLELKLFLLRCAAFEKYKTVEPANNLIDRVGIEESAKLSPEEFLEKLEIRISRPGLTDYERIGLVISTVACGRWESVSSSRNDAFETIKAACENADPTAGVDDIVKGIYYPAQNGLMAYRKDDFYTIQTEPPFSEFGYKNMVRFLNAWRDGGEETLKNEFDQTFAPGWETHMPEQRPIEILSGDGQTEETAIKFSTVDMQKRIRAEFCYVYYSFGKGWDHMHFTVPGQTTGKTYSLWNINLSDGSKKKIYFDTNRD